MMPLTFIAAALRAELIDLDRELMSSAARARLPKLHQLVDEIDGHAMTRPNRPDRAFICAKHDAVGVNADGKCPMCRR